MVAQRADEPDAPTLDMHTVEQLLSASRGRGVRIPPARFVRFAPLPEADEVQLLHPFDLQVHELAKQIPTGTTIAWDLDDTLLFTDFTFGANWKDNDPLRGYAGPDAFEYANMKRDLWLWLRNGWRLQPRFSYSPDRYTFLLNPRVVAQMRPGILALLGALHSNGVKNLLVSATSRVRWEFLSRRIPVLNTLFEDRVICAEELVAHALTLREPLDAWWDNPLFSKTPQRVAAILGNDGYDVLVDDSRHTVEAFRHRGLSKKLLSFEDVDPHRDGVLKIVIALRDHFGVETPAKLEPIEPDAWRQYPYLRFEDPYYFPMIHRPDALSAALVERFPALWNTSESDAIRQPGKQA